MCGLVPEAYAVTDLRLPRYVSVKADEANVRTGPGVRYQIKWVLKRKQMPLEVIAEFEQWRKVRDIQGDEGWAHRSMLTNKRTAIITGDTQTMRRNPSSESSSIARLEVGVIGELLECNKRFCKLRSQDYKGWVDRDFVWGVYPDEWLD